MFPGQGLRVNELPGAVYEIRKYGSVRGMRREPHPTRCLPGEAGKPSGLKEIRVTPTEGKTI